MAKTEKFSDSLEPVGLVVGDTLSLNSGTSGVGEGTAAFGNSVEQFVILQPLGSGGMGRVFLAYDTQLHRHVALKILSENLQSHDESWQIRLLQEARTMAKVNHAHVVPIHSVGQMDDGIFIAMAHVEGGTLKDWLCTSPRPNQVIELLLPIADALAAAHREGVVHRDVKPQNILVSEDGQAFLTDFGIAATLSNSEDESPIAVEGTQGYMAPEQAAGEVPDIRSDIYSYCLTFRKALGGKGSGALQKVLSKGCAARPEDRYSSMEEVGRELRKVRQRRRRWSIIAMIAVATIGAFVLYLYRSSQSVPAMCTAESEDLQEIWNGEREKTLRTHFAATNAVDAKELANQSVLAINRFVQEWRSQRQASCEATHVHREQGEEVLVARQRCYQLRLGELSGVLETLNEKTVLRAVDAIPIPRTLELCSPKAVLQRDKRSVLVGAKAQELGQNLAKLRSLHDLGQYEEGVKLAQSLRLEVEALGSEQHLAEFELVVARHYKTLYRAKEAWTHLKAANVSAANAGDNELVAKIWTQAIFVLGYQLGSNEQAEIAAMAAQAAVEQSRANDAVRSNFLTKLAILRRTQYRWEESEALQKKGMKLRKNYYGETHPLVGKSASNLGNLLVDMGRYEDAANKQELATEIARRSYGAENPALADTLANYVTTIMTMGKHSKALPLQKELLSIFQIAHGPKSKKSLEAKVLLALLQTYLGQNLEARRNIDFVRTAISGASVDINRAEWLLDLARSEMLLGNEEQARKDLSEVYALHRRFPNSRHALSGGSDLLSARVEANSQRCGKSQEYLDKVQQRFNDLPSSSSVERAVAIRTRAVCLMQEGETSLASQYIAESGEMMKSLGVSGFEASLNAYYRWLLTKEQGEVKVFSLAPMFSKKEKSRELSLSDILLSFIDS